MYLDIDALELENFKSFVGKPQLLEFDKLAFGLHYLQGKNQDEPRLGANGCGKSSLWDALCWCFFGRTPDGLRNPDITPWKGSKKVRVTAWVHLGKKAHEITRTANPNKLLLDDAAVTQEQIDALLGIDVATFTNTVLLGQGQPLFFDLTASDKMSMFSTVLALDKWEERAAIAAKQAKELDMEIARKEGTFRSKEQEERSVKAQLETGKQTSAAWVGEQRARVEEQKDRIKQAETSLSNIEKQLNDAVLELDSAGLEAKALDKEVVKVESALEKLKEEGREYETQVRVKKAEHARLRTELNDLGTSDNCPTCGQPLKGKDRTKHRKHLEEQIEALEDVIKKIVPKEHVKKLAEEQARLERVEAQLKGFNDRARAAQRIVDMQGPQVASHKTKIVTAKERITELEREENPYRAQLEEGRVKLRALSKELDDLDDELKQLTKDTEDTKYWVKGFKDVRLYIIDEVVKELELTTNAMLAEVGLDGWEVRYDVEQETKAGTVKRGLNVRILSPRNEEVVKWESWSGGERQRLRIVGALALSEVLLNHAGVNVGLIILDEPASYLSRQGVRELCEFLSDYARQFEKQIFYVDHTAIEGALFASTLTVTKTEKGSFIG